MPSQSRRRMASAGEARVRAEAAQAYLEVAELVLDDTRAAMPGVAAGLAVLAGIAASDSICAMRLAEIPRGQDHRSAATLLRSATHDGGKLAGAFLKLVDLKDQAHYGVTIVQKSTARNAVRWAGLLVAQAQLEIER